MSSAIHQTLNGKNGHIPSPDVPQERLIEALPAAIYTCDAEGRLTFYNKAAVDLWGRSPELQKEFWCGSYRIYRPDGTEMPLDECPMAVALKTGKSVRGVEIIVERPDGERRNILPHPEPILDKAGKVIGAINMLIDITDRKVSELASARLAAIVTSSDDAIISKDMNGIITSWNQGAERILGYKPEEIIGSSILQLIPFELHSEEPVILGKIRAGQHIEHYETVRIRKDGTRVDLSLTVSPIKDDKGRVIGASKIARDVTEAKAIARALAASKERLARELFEHKKTESELSKSNRELEQFAYIASHDLQEPLHMVSSFVDLLARRVSGKLDENEKEYLDFIRQGSKQAKTLIRELLEYSRIGRSTDQQPIDLNKVMVEVTSSLQFVIEESKAELDFKDLPTVRASHLEMLQLFQNLLSNALKYRGERPLHIEIRASKKSEGAWLFAVKDNGIGIEPQYNERIFAMFQRLGTQSESSGTGIGLAVCKKIVEHYGGAIWVESELGKGSTFFFTLPMWD